MDESSPKPGSTVELTADIISAYVSSNHLQVAELPTLIAEVHAALGALAQGPAPAAPAAAKATPAEIRRSIGHDALVSFEDGKPYKTLRRHLTRLGLTPEEYRRKWGLPHDYPMTSASYSERRSELARTLGLGQQRRRGRPEADAEEGGEEA
jgi:predicted transcriptional regulator